MVEGGDMRNAISSGAVAGFRRSKRVRFEMPVGIYVCGENERPIFEEAKTLQVSAHGAILVLTTPVEIGQTLRLINPRTQEEIECCVRRFALRYPGGVDQVGVEFAASAPTFWDIPSRPPDWDPAWVPPAERQRPQRRLPTNAPPNPLLRGRASDPLNATTQSLVLECVRSLKPVEARPSLKGWRAHKSLVLVLACSVALIVVWTAMPHELTRPVAPAAAAAKVAAPTGLPTEMAGIPDIAGFRIATAGDFDAEAVSWLQRWGLAASGKIPGNYSVSGKSQAYVLLGKDQSWRVVILADGQLRCDVRYQAIAIAARVPKEFTQSIQWDEPVPPESDGDGLLIVRSAKDPGSGVVLFLQGTDVVSGTRPADYRQIHLGHVP
jgi:hypothetical protein